MKNGSLIFNQFRCDFRQLGWIMAAWTGWIATEAIAGWWRWHAAAGAESHHNVVFFTERILPFIGAVLVVVVAPALAFCHPLWRSDAFWRTRPIPVRHLYLTRIGFLLIAVGLIPMTVRFGVLVSSGVEIRLALIQSAGISLIYLAAALSIWALAVHFPRWRYFAVAAVILVPLVLPNLMITFSDVSTGVGIFYFDELPAGLKASRTLVGLILLMLGGLIAGAVLFKRRLRWLGAGILGFATIAAVTSSIWWQANLFAPAHLGTVSSAASTGIRYFKTSRDSANMADQHTVRGDLFWKTSEVPDGNWMGQIYVTTRYPKVSGSLRFEQRIPFVDSPEMEVSAQMALENLGGDLVNRKNWDRLGESESVRIPLTRTGRFPNLSKIRGEIRVHWFTYEVAGSMPLEPGARFARDGHLFAIDSASLRWDSRNQRKRLTIVLIPDRVRTRFTGNEYGNSEPSSEPFWQWHLALWIPAGVGGNDQDGFDSYRLGRTGPTGFPEPQAIYEVPVFDKANPNQPPLVTEENLPYCRLVILQPVYRETMFVPVEASGEP